MIPVMFLKHREKVLMLADWIMSSRSLNNNDDNTNATTANNNRRYKRRKL